MTPTSLNNGAQEIASAIEAAEQVIAPFDPRNAAKPGPDPKPARTQADVLIGITEKAALFHTPDGTAYADLMVDGHRETWPLRQKGFRRWLARGFYEAAGGAPSSEALQAALNVIEARAQYAGPQRDVHVRVARDGDRLYLDLGGPCWRAVEIDASGWRVVDNPQVRFCRSSGVLPLPVPIRGGAVEALRPFLNVSSHADFVLAVSWLLACFRNRGPYPVMALSGEQGTAKSTFAAMMRSLVDPNIAPLRALPREERDLFIAACNAHVLAFDNVSTLPTWMSDALCRLATGGAFAVRQLYADQDEILFKATRPIILNGIEDVISRPDLADRSLFLTLEPIPDARRRPETQLWEAFEKARPLILGGLLDAVAKGLEQEQNVLLGTLPRMADFAIWVTACETAIWPKGAFQAAYDGNRDEIFEDVIEADPVASAVRDFALQEKHWSGTATDLLLALSEFKSGHSDHTKHLPKTPRALSGHLRRAATFLRKTGIDTNFGRSGHQRQRIIQISMASKASEPERLGVSVSAPSARASSCDSGEKPIVTTVAGVADGADAVSLHHSGDDLNGSMVWSAG